MPEVEFQSAFLREASERGFLYQCTDLKGLDDEFTKTAVSGYIGFDLTADSLHVGHMIQIMMLRLMRKHGHVPVVLLGGGTTRIGDPSFRDEARRLLSEATIDENCRHISASLESLLGNNHDSRSIVILNNTDWLDRLSYIDLLQAVGSEFSINRMLSFDSVKTRMLREQGLTFLEFNYAILQSYDFLELFRRQGVKLQMGGSDQWANIISGVDLIRRIEHGHAFGLTAPLLTTASGKKMGKTASGAVWLSRSRLAPLDYWRFWRATEDADVGRFLRLFTELPVSRCDDLIGENVSLRSAKEALATEATAICHGREVAEAVCMRAMGEFPG